tara:strand:+ start:524 stop:814 length:291 start_codon:yes stop_codon:yes gene_type:complete
MKIEKQKLIISGFMGFAIGACSMMFVNIDKEVKQIERFDRTEFTIRENINTCEDIIEWMGQDVENYADSTIFDSYIWNLEEMCEENRYILQSNYDY